MIPILSHFCRRFSAFKILSKKDLFNMNKAYFRQCEGDQMEISFLYKNPDLGIERQFNFNRKSTESVETLTNRISTNLDKIIFRKKKRKASKMAESDSLPAADTISPSTVQFFIDEEVVPGAEVCEAVLRTDKNVTLQMNEFVYNVVVNSPCVDNFKLPLSIMVGFPAYPAKCEAVYMEKEHTEFIWYSGKTAGTGTDRISWEERHRGFIYTPVQSDMNKRLKLTCIPGNSRMKGPKIEAITIDYVEAGPGHCPFQTRHLYTGLRLQGKSFRVVSYNILADLYTDSDFSRLELFPYCPTYALGIDYRKQLILKELIGYNSDIICLQEVDTKLFHYDLQRVLSEQNYKGIFCKKGALVAEGVACFYNTERFELLDSHRIVFSETLGTSPIFDDIWEKIRDNEPLVQRVMEKATAVQAVVLKPIECPDEILLVGNTHLYFHPDADHIRLLQGGLAIRWLQDILTRSKVSHPDKRVSMVFCGDFNSVPDCGIYQLYIKGSVDGDHIDWKSNAEQKIEGLSLSQDVPLDSAYGTPPYTNFTVGFTDCLDYIFYTKDSIHVEQVIPLPSIEELKQHTALPSVVAPSDHIALVADLKYS